MIGTGTIKVANLICSSTWKSASIDIGRVHELFLILQPTFSGLIASTLRASWLALGFRGFVLAGVLLGPI